MTYVWIAVGTAAILVVVFVMVGLGYKEGWQERGRIDAAIEPEPPPTESIDAIVRYNWNKEKDDYDERLFEGEPVERHVFTDLLRVDNWLQKIRAKEEA